MQGYAPKVAIMLTDLPVAEIQKYLVNFDLFLQHVSEAAHAAQLLDFPPFEAQQN